MEERCNAIPYAGKEPFVFVHFSGKDKNQAYTLIEKLAAEGYRIWYVSPEALHSYQNEEVADMISKKIAECTAVIALYSENAANDHQFRKIITVSVLDGKKIIPVFLEDIQLSCGMRLQYAQEECVQWYAVADDLQMLCGKKDLKRVKGVPDPSVRVVYRKGYSAGMREERPGKNVWPVSVIFEDEEEILRDRRMVGKQPENSLPEKQDKKENISENEEDAEKLSMLQIQQQEREMHDSAAENEQQKDIGQQIKKETTQELAAAQEENRKTFDKTGPAALQAEKVADIKLTGQFDFLATMMIDEDKASSITRTELDVNEDRSGRQGHNGTMIIDEIDPIAVMLPTGEYYKGCYGLTKIGRGSGNHICIQRDTVSTNHLEVMSVSGSEVGYKNTVKDCYSSNGTWVDGRRLESGAVVSVGDHALINLSRKVQMYIAFGDAATQLATEGMLACLECCEDHRMHVLDESSVMLGRIDPWNNAFFDDARISREHARLDADGHQYIITDQSSNGTYINGKKIEKYKATELQSGDKITMGGRVFQFHLITLKEK